MKEWTTNTFFGKIPKRQEIIPVRKGISSGRYDNINKGLTKIDSQQILYRPEWK